MVPADVMATSSYIVRGAFAISGMDGTGGRTVLAGFAVLVGLRRPWYDQERPRMTVRTSYPFAMSRVIADWICFSSNGVELTRSSIQISSPGTSEKYLRIAGWTRTGPIFPP